MIGENGEQRVTATKDRPQRREPVTYLVYESTDGGNLAFVAEVTAQNKDEARWAAVDKVGGELASRTRVKEGEAGGVPLVPIAQRHTHPVLTREKLVMAKHRE